MSGVRFNHHWCEGSAAGGGMSLTPHGRLALVSGDDEIRQALVMLLSTRPGERVMRPDYGCPLDRLMFSPLDATTEGLAIHYVRDAIERWEPRAALDLVDAAPCATPGSATYDSLQIILNYTARATARAETLTFTLDLFGGQD